MDTVDEAYERGENPATYVSEKERKRLEQERRDEEERQQRIRARCSSAPELIRAAFAQREYAEGYKIAEESEGVCHEAERVNSALTTEVRKMSPQEVATCRSSGIAKLYWRPLDIWDWFDAANDGKLIREQGVSIYGTVTQLIDGHAMIGTANGIRVVIRLGQRAFKVGWPVYAIGQFVEIRHLTTTLGTPADIPIFDLVFFFSVPPQIVK